MAGSASITRGFVALPGGPVHYRSAGSGPTLLLLHPNGTSSALFEEAIPLLADSYRVIAPDRYGHGDSASLPMDFPRYAEDGDREDGAGRIEPYLVAVELAFLDALGVDRVSVVGQHTGSHLALELAIAAPHRVEQLVLVSLTDWQTRGEADAYATPPRWSDRASAFLDVDRLAAAREARTHYEEVGRLAADGGHLTAMWRMRGDAQSGPRTTPEILHRVTMMALQCIGCWPDTSPQVELYYRANRRLPLTPVPTALVAGVNDEPGMFLEQQAELIPTTLRLGSELVPEVGAFFALEDPRGFADLAVRRLRAPVA